MVIGPTNSGKTVLVHKIVQNAAKMFHPHPQKIIWCYTEHQNTYNIPGVEYIKGLPKQLNKGIGEGPTLLIFDDMMTELKENADMMKLFTRGCHHWNCSIIHIVQDAFFDRRTNRINTQYLVLMKNPADKLTACNIGRQMFPQDYKDFIRAYTEATEKPHSYLLLDLEQNTPERFRLRSNILPNETTSAWLIKRTTAPTTKNHGRPSQTS